MLNRKYNKINSNIEKINKDETDYFQEIQPKNNFCETLVNYFKYTDEDLKIQDIKVNPSLIKDILNPSEKMQIAAVKSNKEAIKYIKEPCEKAQLIYCSQLRYDDCNILLKNPCVKAQVEIFKNVRLLINDVDLARCSKPEFFKDVYIEAVISSIKYQTNWNSSTFYFESGLLNKEFYIPYKNNEKVQLAAVQRHGNNIKYIENPSKEIQIMAVSNYYRAIQYIKNPSEEIQIIFVRNFPSSIQYIKNPSRKVRMSAALGSWNLVRYIRLSLGD